MGAAADGDALDAIVPFAVATVNHCFTHCQTHGRPHFMRQPAHADTIHPMLKPRVLWLRALIAIASLMLLLALSAGLGMAIMAGALRLWPGLLQSAQWAQPPAAPSATPAPTATALPSATATAVATFTATPIFQLPGRVTGDQLRLRRTPGSAGERIARLPTNTTLALQGRSADFTWFEVTTTDGLHGWVGAEYIELVGQIADLPVTGQIKMAGDEASVARNASPAPALLSAPDSRDKPVVEFLLLPDTPLGLAGRSSDGLWLQVVSPYGDIGWVPADKVNLLVPIDAVAITFEAAAAPAPEVAAADLPTAASDPANSTSVATPPGTTTAADSATPAGTAVALANATATTVRAALAATIASATPVPAKPTGSPLPTKTLAAFTQPPTQPVPKTPAAPFDPKLYISNITPRAREIFLAGQARGNRADRFSKVGDSITIPPQFLALIDKGDYNLRRYAALQATIDFFSATPVRNGSSFANQSLAAKFGWPTRQVLNPWAAGEICSAGEIPLECEYRLTQPAVALIMLGTNDVPSTPAAVYADALREIVEFSILRGVIPALSTIPSFNRAGSEQRPRELNAIVVALALDYQIPLWDFWAATQHLPNHGLSGDGVHPAWGPAPADFTEDNLRQYGGAMRNLLALQMLDSLRTQVMK